MSEATGLHKPRASSVFQWFFKVIKAPTGSDECSLTDRLQYGRLRLISAALNSPPATILLD
jgi:hypothetical protein